jgi:hypothetical protein
MPATIGCKVSKNGHVTVMLIKKGKPEAVLSIPAKDVGGLVVMLLASAMEAAKTSGESPRARNGASLVGMPCIQPTAIALSESEPPEPRSHVVVHAGMAQFGIALPKPHELAHELWLVGKRESSLEVMPHS